MNDTNESIPAYQAIQAANLKPGESFAVIGCGGLGQLGRALTFFGREDLLTHP